MNKMEKNYKICSRCVCDTTISHIKFDDNGVCNFCKSHDAHIDHYNKEIKSGALFEIIQNIRKEGEGKKYDCIIGVSGGTDSIYTLYLAKNEWKLRPLAVHFDNGWNKNIAVENIKKACTKLEVDLYTYVVNWEEFKNLQLAFLKASVPDVEIPTDIGIHGILYKTAKEEGLKYILGGQCFKAEGTVPIEWSFIDGTYLKDVYGKFGSKQLKTFPNITVGRIVFYTLLRRIKQIPVLNYIDYNKVDARRVLEDELGWQYYGGHHYENMYSHFAFGYYSLVKFGIDKRKISLSGPIRMGLIGRKEAMEEIKTPPIVNQEEVDYCIKKLGLTREEFEKIICTPNQSFHDYYTSYSALKFLRPSIKLAARFKFISPVVYEKFLNH